MKPQHDTAPIVIVGASLAGVSAAETLRNEGYEGGLVLLSQEDHLPYDRPPLSKDVLRPAEEPDNLALHEADFYTSQNIDLRLGVAAVRIEPSHRCLRLSTGDSLSYDALLLATGSRTRELEAFPRGAPRVHYLRTMEDALRLRNAMQAHAGSGRLLVVGAGIIGLEVAAVAAEHALAVTVIEQGSRPLERAASASLSAFLGEAHRRRGVDIRCGVRISSVQAGATHHLVQLSDGACVEADLVVVGIGVIPNLELARDAGIETNALGILVDGQGRTSHTHIYAAGEVSFHYNEYQGTHRREETWQHAVNHGNHVARCILGGEKAYAEPMSYWTDQYDYSVQVFGNPHGTREVLRGDPDTGSFSLFHLDERGICGVTAVNAMRDLRRAKPLVVAYASVPDEVIRNLELDPARHVASEAHP